MEGDVTEGEVSEGFGKVVDSIMVPAAPVHRHLANTSQNDRIRVAFEFFWDRPDRVLFDKKCVRNSIGVVPKKLEKSSKILERSSLCEDLRVQNFGGFKSRSTL